MRRRAGEAGGGEIMRKRNFRANGVYKFEELKMKYDKDDIFLLIPLYIWYFNTIVI